MEPFEFGGVGIAPGTQTRVDLALGMLPTHAPITLPMMVCHGASPGPVLWVCGAVHGDELNSLEIVRRLLRRINPGELRGTLLLAPLINVLGLLHESRYLPDRRDLNRSFPGQKRGSLASRIAHLVHEQILARGDFGIDLHTGSDHRVNLAQIRGDLDDTATLELAQAFAPPVILHAKDRDGSIREAAASRGIPVLLFEGGEAMRFDEAAISAAVSGLMRVLAHVKMHPNPEPSPSASTMIARESGWVRARSAGILRLKCKLGDRVTQGELLGAIEGLFGENPKRVKAPDDGIIIGLSTNPLVYQGDAVVHIARA